MALVEIARFLDPVETQVATSSLRARGFYVHVQNEGLQPIWYLAYGLGGFRLWTTAGDAEAAMLLLRADRTAPMQRRPTGGLLLTIVALALTVGLGHGCGWAAVRLFGRREPQVAGTPGGAP